MNGVHYNPVPAPPKEIEFYVQSSAGYDYSVVPYEQEFKSTKLFTGIHKCMEGMTWGEYLETDDAKLVFEFDYDGDFDYIGLFAEGNKVKLGVVGDGGDYRPAKDSGDGSAALRTGVDPFFNVILEDINLTDIIVEGHTYTTSGTFARGD